MCVCNGSNDTTKRYAISSRVRQLSNKPQFLWVYRRNKPRRMLREHFKPFRHYFYISVAAAGTPMGHLSVRCPTESVGIGWNGIRIRDLWITGAIALALAAELKHFSILGAKFSWNAQNTQKDKASKVLTLRRDFFYRVLVNSRVSVTRIQSRGIFPGAKVVRGGDWQWKDQDGGEGKEGVVIELRNWKKSPRRGVLVSWDYAEKNTYRLGVKGKVSHTLLLF